MTEKDRHHHRCNRCNYEWISKKKRPGTCAKCRSPYWNKKRVRETK